MDEKYLYKYKYIKIFMSKVVRTMMSEEVKRAIEVFYPVEDTKDAWNKVVLEWLDSKTTKLEEKVMEFERKYGTEFTEFDDGIKRKGASFEEEDDWIDWGDYIDLLESLKKYRRDVLLQLKKHQIFLSFHERQQSY